MPRKIKPNNELKRRINITLLPKVFDDANTLLDNSTKYNSFSELVEKSLQSIIQETTASHLPLEDAKFLHKKKINPKSAFLYWAESLDKQTKQILKEHLPAYYIEYVNKQKNKLIKSEWTEIEAEISTGNFSLENADLTLEEYIQDIQKYGIIFVEDENWQYLVACEPLYQEKMQAWLASYGCGLKPQKIDCYENAELRSALSKAGHDWEQYYFAVKF